MEINFGDICRTCLNKSTDFKSINELTEHSLTYVEMIQYCTSVQVKDVDLLPSNICKACAKLLVTLYEFKKQTERVNRVLESYLQQQIKGSWQTVTDAVPHEEDIIIDDDPSDSDTDKCAVPVEARSLLVEVKECEESATLVSCAIPVDAPSLPVEVEEREESARSAQVEHRESEKGEEEKLKQPRKDVYRCVSVDARSFRIEVDEGEESTTLAQSDGEVGKEEKLQQPGKSVDCEVCGERFEYSPHALPGKYEHKCLTCSNTFTTKYPLQKHMKIHTSEKDSPARHQKEKCLKEPPQEIISDVKCKCGKPVKYGSMLSSTARPAQKGEQECAICDKMFTKRSRLKQHVTVHTGEKNYECRVCKRRFRRASCQSPEKAEQKRTKITKNNE